MKCLKTKIRVDLKYEKLYVNHIDIHGKIYELINNSWEYNNFYEEMISRKSVTITHIYRKLTHLYLLNYDINLTHL